VWEKVNLQVWGFSYANNTLVILNNTDSVMHRFFKFPFFFFFFFFFSSLSFLFSFFLFFFFNKFYFITIMPEGFSVDVSKAVGHKFPADTVNIHTVPCCNKTPTCYFFFRLHVPDAISYYTPYLSVYLKLNFNGFMSLVNI
jgi:hypothetical protein